MGRGPGTVDLFDAEPSHPTLGYRLAQDTDHSGGFGGRILLFLAGNQGQGEQRSRKDQFTHGSLFSRLGELNRTGLIDMPTLAGTPGKCGKWKDICRLPHCHMSSRQLMVAPRPMPFVPAMLWAEAGW